MSFHESVSSLPPPARLRVAIKISDDALLREVLTAHPELLDLPDDGGRTPLHLAAEWQDFPIVTALVELGANVTAKDRLGYTPRDIAGWHSKGAYDEVSQKIVACLELPPQSA